MFRDALKPSVIFRLRPLMDLRHPRDAFRLRRKMEQRKHPAKELQPLEEGPLAPEVEARRDPFDDDHLSELRDDWRAERCEWERDEYGIGPF